MPKVPVQPQSRSGQLQCSRAAYRPDGRTLAIVEEHASLIRHLFTRYLELGSVRLLQKELQAQGTGLPTRTRSNNSSAYGGGWFSRGQIYKILSNPIYIGRIQHGARSYPGLHPSIIDPPLFEAVQARLADHRQGTRERVRAASPSLLAGKLTDDAGQPLIATHASVKNRRYHYYVSQPLHHARDTTGMRIPAREIETAVTAQMATLFDDPVQLMAQAWLMVPADLYLQATARAKEIVAKLQQRDRVTTRQLLTSARIERGQVVIALATAAIAEAMQLTLAADAPASLTLHADVRLTRSGRAMRLVHSDGAHQTAAPNASLARLLAQAHRYWRELRKGEVNVSELASTEGISPAYLTRVLRLAFLSPQVTDAILAGRLRGGIDALGITGAGAIELSWSAQAAAWLPSANIAAV